MNFTNYWENLAVYFACKLNLFDFVLSGCIRQNDLAIALNVKENILFNLLGYLTEAKFLHYEENYSVTELGYSFTDESKIYLKDVCILWNEEHLHTWQQGLETFKDGRSSFQSIYKMNYFEYLELHPEKLDTYHKALTYFARKDYSEISSLLDLKNVKTALDLGGGYGALVELLKSGNPEINFTILDLPNVIKKSPKLNEVNYRTDNFLNPLQGEYDAIFLSKLLHDWNDLDSITIIKNCKNLISDNGKIYILEILTNRIDNFPFLLSLNMQIICGSKERSEEEYRNLLKQAGFKIEAIHSLNSLQSIIVGSLN